MFIDICAKYEQPLRNNMKAYTSFKFIDTTEHDYIIHNKIFEVFNLYVRQCDTFFSYIR